MGSQDGLLETKRQATTSEQKMAEWESNEEIQIFREYLRIPSVHPNVNYDDCVKFLHVQATRVGLPIRVYHPGSETRPVVVLTWIGSQPELPSILLNSHMDVVPVYEDHWTHPPFAAEIDSEGRIFARGSQDTKQIGVQYLAAIHALKREGIQLKRTVHVLFVPDEEIGGVLGMGALVKSDDFKSLNVGFELDEGGGNGAEAIFPLYAERTICRPIFTCTGTSGHAAILLKNTAAAKMQFILNKMLALRSAEEAKLKNNPDLDQGDVTTVNLTKVNGGIQSNIVPSDITMLFDCRLAIDVDHDAFFQQLENWCTEAGGDVKLEFERRDPPSPATSLDESNPFWMAFKSLFADEMKQEIRPRVCMARSDASYIRAAGIPAIGYSPWASDTPTRMHDHDEFLTAQTFLLGIEIYKKLIPKLANV